MSKRQANNPADLVLITDIHPDHFDIEALLQLNTSEPKFIMPESVASLIPTLANAYHPKERGNGSILQ
jgi:L-ascorbate metabolism protein UlaG (beta-lactamase superfamily)